MGQRYQKEQIDEWLEDWQKSGKSAKEFRLGKPFHSSTLDYWRRKISKNELPKSFISISNPQENYLKNSSISLANGTVINLGYQLNITQVKELLV